MFLSCCRALRTSPTDRAARAAFSMRWAVAFTSSWRSALGLAFITSFHKFSRCSMVPNAVDHQINNVEIAHHFSRELTEKRVITPQRIADALTSGCTCFSAQYLRSGSAWRICVLSSVYKIALGYIAHLLQSSSFPVYTAVVNKEPQLP